MEFNIDSFGSQFRYTIDWMLQGKCRDLVKKHLDDCLRRKSELGLNSDSPDVLRFLVALKVTNSWYRDLPDSFDGSFHSFLEQYGADFRTPDAQERLSDLISKYSVLRIPKEKARQWVDRLLNTFPTLSNFTEELYRLRDQGKKSELFGDKGADDYLRSFGKWDRIPIDIHERRFLLRSGIYHAFGIGRKQDPLQDRCLQDSLRNFCKQCLQGKIVENLDLARYPGIVDIFIWSFCADKGYNICGSAPRCGDCPLRDSCFFGICRHLRYKVTDDQEG